MSDTPKWVKGKIEWVYVNKYGCICGSVRRDNDVRYSTMHGSQWCGDYLTLAQARDAVAHAYKDPHGLAYPMK